MKLRIARKMDQRRGRDKRVWWQVYSCDQLLRAQRRLERSWKTACPIFIDKDGREYRKLVADFFAMNRVNARRIRRGALRKHLRGQAQEKR